MASEVGSGQVAIFPVFKGFRKAVDKETEGAADSASKGFRRSFDNAGQKAGQSTGKGFKAAFEGSVSGFSTKATKTLEADVAKAAKALSAARLKEQDAAGKARVAEAQLGEVRRKYAADSSQVIRAEERLASATRNLRTAQDGTASSTRGLRDAQSSLARSADSASEGMADAGRRGARGFGSSFVAGVGKLAAPIAVAIAGLGIAAGIQDAVSTGLRAAAGYVTESVGLASDFEQSVGGVSAVFKDQADEINKWAEAAAQGVGLSKQQYNDFATIVGSQLKNLGLPLDQVADQTNTIISLGADLAAQYGGSTADAVSALSSLLRGERDPIERYGVSFNEAAVSAEAMALGLVGVTQNAEDVQAAQLRAEVAQRKYNDAIEAYGEDSTQALSAQASLISAQSSLETAMAGSTDEITAQQKAQATLSLLTKQTADAQGAFGREASTAAGQQARLQAELMNSQTALGTALLPTITQLTKLANEELIPVLNDVVDEVGPELSSALVESAPAVKDLILALTPLLPQLVQLAVQGLPPLVRFLTLISPLLIDWATNTASIMTALNAFFALLDGDTSLLKVGAEFQGLGGSVFDMVMGLATFLSQANTNIVNFATTVRSQINDVVGTFIGIPQRVEDGLGDLGSRLVSSGRALVQGFIDGINEMFPGLDTAVGGLMDFVGGFFPNSPAKRGPFSGSGWTALKESGKAIITQFSDGFGDGPDPFGGRGPSYGGGPSAPAAPALAGVSGVPRQGATINVHPAQGKDEVAIGRAAAEWVNWRDKVDG
ncbi:hypothetical protein SCB71_06290 [Herbiconiux sp. KACC 21604]|uniref:hypothetical protein n=1 Tax=unclassified Herbiconiux TaxID=2618217 RepID=UPI001492974A|nr:hypothetical protein [Herbiconiux sp. SALV-R1]QJU52927.1 hypothetical protein HL652_04275 [Herbiconiux sp. SALV-R1]WPO87847.1 hypothetical protein SCB71_06290 [Herbiconiux sp. KACC 21604]